MALIRVISILPSIVWSDLSRSALSYCIHQETPHHIHHTIYFILSGCSESDSFLVQNYLSNLRERIKFSHRNIIIKFFFSSNLLNGAVARNIGLEFAYKNNFDFISFVDSDDFVSHSKLATQISFLISNPTVSICGTKKLNVNLDSSCSSSTLVLPQTFACPCDSFVYLITPMLATYMRHRLPHMSSLVLRTSALRPFLFDVRLLRFQDLDMLVYLSCLHCFVYVLDSRLVQVNRSSTLAKCKNQSLSLALYFLCKYNKVLPIYIPPLFLLKYVFYPRIKLIFS